MRLGFDLLGQRRGQPRLANARLARYQNHPSLTALRLLPATGQQLDLLLAPDKWRLPRAQCLEPADLAALAQHPPRALRVGEAGELLRSEVLQVEEPADLPAGRFGDDECVWRGQ